MSQYLFHMTRGISFRSHWRATTALVCALAFVAGETATASPALPTGGSVRSGSAVIAAPNSGVLTISQSSADAIINWSSFSIGTNGVVQILNNGGKTLNRVTGASRSVIQGMLTSPGTVYILNENGVIIGKTGVVDVGGTFVASTLADNEENLFSGDTHQLDGASDAKVVNLGSITSQDGQAVLAAAIVDNQGSITAQLGDAGILAGHSVLFHSNADKYGHFSVMVGGGGTVARNTGSIQAAIVELKANGGNIFALAGNTNGVINATGFTTGEGGQVFLVAEDGKVRANGTIIASESDGSSGEVGIEGHRVNLENASISAGDIMVHRQP